MADLPAPIKVVIPARLDGTRLDKALAEVSELSRTTISKLLKLGLVTDSRGESPRAATTVTTGMKFIVLLPAERPPVVSATDLSSLNLIYEDDDLLVINKPPGLTVHPGSGTGESLTLAHLVHTYLPSIKEARYSDSVEDRQRAGLVHRLDKETSGVMVVAKTLPALVQLKHSFQEREITKHYQAICYGHPVSQLIDAPLGKHPRHWWKRAVVPTGKAAQTNLEVQQKGDLYHRPASLVEARPHTGRTHQIRVHLAYLGCPILGDPRYANHHSQELTRLAGVPRLMLHAAQLRFRHPISHKEVNFEAPLPDDFNLIARQL